MRICFSTRPDDHWQLSLHFGASGAFTVYDTETQTLSAHPSQAQPCRGPCHCAAPEPEGFDVVICGAIGHLVQRDLRRRGVAIFQTRETNLMSALAAWQACELAPVFRGVCRIGRRHAAKQAETH